MNFLKLLHDERFNIVFSFALGLGIICLIRPICSGKDCDVIKSPTEKDFDTFVYRMSGGQCYEFQTNIVSCPASGTVEAFRECSSKDSPRDQFSRRETPIQQCE
uniref:Uncharacterized protein n=1 Tax=viral metagenome TaxID=1070528 RepID=A0A6C0KKM7_9ZZZZ